MKPSEIKKVLECIRDTHSQDCHFCYEAFTKELIRQFKQDNPKKTELKNIIKKTYIKRFGKSEWNSARTNKYFTWIDLNDIDNYDRIYWYKS